MSADCGGLPVDARWTPFFLTAARFCVLESCNHEMWWLSWVCLYRSAETAGWPEAGRRASALQAEDVFTHVRAGSNPAPAFSNHPAVSTCVLVGGVIWAMGPVSKTG